MAGYSARAPPTQVAGKPGAPTLALQAVMVPRTPGIKAETLRALVPLPISSSLETGRTGLDDTTCNLATQEAEAGGQPD